MRVCQSSVMSLDEIIDQPKGFSADVSDADWEILGQSEPKV